MNLLQCLQSRHCYAQWLRCACGCWDLCTWVVEFTLICLWLCFPSCVTFDINIITQICFSLVHPPAYPPIHPSMHPSTYLATQSAKHTAIHSSFDACILSNFLFVHYLFTMLRQHSCLYPVEYSQVTNWLLITKYTKMDLHSNDTEWAVSILPIFLLCNV